MGIECPECHFDNPDDSIANTALGILYTSTEQLKLKKRK